MHHSSLLRARAVPRWLWSTVPMKRALLQRKASVHRRAPVVRRASCGLRHLLRITSAYRCLCGGGDELDLLRARTVPRWLWSAYASKGTAPVRCLFPSARARAATCQLRPPLCAAGYRVARASGPGRWMSVGIRRSTRAFCLRTPCRPDCRRPELVREKDTAPTRGLSSPARARGATFQLQPPTAGHHRVPHVARAPALAVSGEEAQHSSLLLAHAVPA